jgi:large subunit ribosomal protein L1
MAKTKVKEMITELEETPAVSAEETVVEEKLIEEKKEAKTAPKKSDPKDKKTSKPSHSKKYLATVEKVDKSKAYSLNEAVDLAKSVSYSKFEGTLEIHINTAAKGIRGLVMLPYASGKKLRILAFGKGAEESGADLIGDDDALKELEKGKVNCDVIVTTPEWMPKLARAAKVLGPRGLMPNPKNGTISTDLKKVIAELQGGKTEYKSEAKANVVHLAMGKVSQPTEELSANVKILLNTIGKSRIKKVTLSPTMGPGVKLDLSSI